MKGHRLAKCDGTGLDLATVFWVLKVMNLEDHIEFLCPLFEQVNWGREIPSVSNLTNSDLISAGRGTCGWESWVVLRHTTADSPGTSHDSGAPWRGSKALTLNSSSQIKDGAKRQLPQPNSDFYQSGSTLTQFVFWGFGLRILWQQGILMFSKPVPGSSHDASTRSFIPASSLRCDGF